MRERKRCANFDECHNIVDSERDDETLCWVCRDYEARRRERRKE